MLQKAGKDWGNVEFLLKCLLSKNCGKSNTKGFLFWRVSEISHLFRSSRSQMFFKIGVLKNFAIFTGKSLCWSLFLIKLLKRNTNTGFSCEKCKIFKNTFFTEHLSPAASVSFRYHSSHTKILPKKLWKFSSFFGFNCI